MERKGGVRKCAREVLQMDNGSGFLNIQILDKKRSGSGKVEGKIGSESVEFRGNNKEVRRT